MILDLAGCEWMKLGITTEPETVPTDWEASIDHGQTWVRAHLVDGVCGWLVAGPNYQGGSSPDFTATMGYTTVKVRLIYAPETVISEAPLIECTDV